MKSRFKIFVYLFVVIFSFLVSYSGYAACSNSKLECSQKEYKQKRGCNPKKMFKDLNLTKEQEEQLEVNRKNHWEEMKSLKEEMWNKKKAIRNELAKDDVNLQEVNRIHQELKDILVKKEDLRLESILEIKKILTPEQFKKFNEKCEENRKKCKGMKKKMSYR